MNGQADARFPWFCYVNFSYVLCNCYATQDYRRPLAEGSAAELISLNENSCRFAVNCNMDSPEEYRLMASDLRRLAAESGALARRAKLFILAEQFEELANDFEKELAHRLRLGQSMAANN